MSSLDEILARLTALPDDQRNEAVAEAEAATAGMKWLPSPGPQVLAYFHKADVLLYGGQGGGGKSDLGLGLAFTAHKRSLILRRKYTNLDALIERAIEINGTRDGFNGSPPPKLRTSDGRLITFGANQHLGDEAGFQGQPFDFKCVGRGTLVQMANGTYQAIETLRVGDLVATLEGPRRVNRLFPVRRDEAIRLEVRDEAGELVCCQDQSLTHEVLTRSGWACHDKFDESSQLSTFESKGSREVRKLSEPSAGSFRVGAQRLLHFLTGRKRAGEAVQGFLARWGLSGSVASGGQLLPGIVFSTSYASRQEIRLLLGSSALQGPQLLPHGSSASSTWRHIFGSRSGDARFWSALQDWKARCWSGSRPCGEHVRPTLNQNFGQADGLIYLRQLSDAELPSPTCSEGDDREKTPIRTRHINKYVHPYTKETRQVAPELERDDRTLSTSRIGVIELYDIEVDEVNHFITHGGVVNKNCFDEAVQFHESQIRFHLGWMRSTEPGQRVRALLATNPPIDAEGDWIIGMFRPWLDVTYSKPAKHGELRFFVTAPDGSDVEVDGPEMIQLPGMKEPVQPLSRSFLPAALRDNPYLIDTGYQAKLDALPEPLRSAVRDGNFMALRSDAEFQVIPTAWVIAAQERWTPRPPPGFAMTAMGFDPAGGGTDAAALAFRYGGWYAEIVTAGGEETADGSRMAALVMVHRRDACPVVVDMGGGYGGAVTQRMRDNGVAFIGFNGAGKSSANTVGASKLSFVNKRAESWWRFREALDPDQDGGSAVCLPPDPELRAELTAPTWELKPGGILIESKDELRKRLGRSPNKADAVVMALSTGDAAVKRMMASRSDMPTRANTGFASIKRMYGRK